jgi:hypothetical protein
MQQSGYRPNGPLLFIDGNIVDRLSICVGTRDREGQGPAIPGQYFDHVLDHFSHLGSGDLVRRVVDDLVGACIVGGAAGRD